MRHFIVVAAAIVCTLLPVAAQVYSDRVNGTLMVGFRAAYCGALAMRRNANPYRSQLLHDCERSSPSPYFGAITKITLPAPYPPYALALIAPLTRLDFPRAALVWWTLLAICCVAAGVVVYAVMTSLGVFLGIRLARRYFEPAFVALIPPALILAKQSFLHTVEIAVAIPVCLLLYSRTSSYRRAVIVSLILLAVPWMGATSAALLLAPIFPIAYLAYVLGGRQRIVALSSAFASLSVVVLILVLAPQARLHATTITALNWQALVLSAPTQTSMDWWLRWPAWIGLLLLLSILSREGEVLQPQRAQS